MTRETIHLVGNFKPDVLERWVKWAALTNRNIKYTTMEDLDGKLFKDSSPIIIMDDHGLNYLPIP